MEIKEKIIKIIKDNDVCLFMKGTANAPQCGFSNVVANVLKHLKVNFKDYYFSNVIARSSKTMLDCYNSKLDIKRTGTEG